MMIYEAGTVIRGGDWGKVLAFFLKMYIYNIVLSERHKVHFF